MSETVNKLLIGTLCVALMAGATWLWFTTMEQVPIARFAMSDALRDNPRLGATMLLRRHGHQVELADTLADLPLQKLADGTLLVSDSGGIITGMQAQPLLAWVARGNTLVMQPHWLNKGEGESGTKASGGRSAPMPKPPSARGENDTDAIGTRLGVRLGPGQQQKSRCDPDAANDAASAEDEKKAAKAGVYAGIHFVCLSLPGKSYPLEIDIGGDMLVTLPGGKVPAWSDPQAEGVRIYKEGKGHIVMLANDYFDQARLPRYDHAELLLALAGLNGSAKRVFIVQRFDVAPWYVALWKNFKPALISLTLGLALLFWAAVRRFGPVLPEPKVGRRALIEHIDASGHWLWKIPGGRAVLLAAARTAALAAVSRRAPELLVGAPKLQIHVQTLARMSGLAETELQTALLQPAASRPEVFTRQILTLQKLRQYYER